MADLDLTPPVLNLIAYSGDDRQVTIRVTDAAGNPFTLVPPFLAQIKTQAGDDTWEGQLPFTSSDPASGVGVLTIQGAVTELLLGLGGATVKTWKTSAGVFRQETWVGVWDLQQGNAGAEDVLTLCGGTFTVKGDVTRESP